MQSSSTFIRISVPIPEVKKSALINDYENIIAYSEEAVQSEVWANKCGLFQIHLGWGGGGGWTEGQCHLRKIWLLLLSFKLGNSIPST